MGLDPERFERTICVTRWPPAEGISEPVQKVLDDLDAADVRFLGIPRRSTAHLHAWRPVLRLLRPQHTDVLHSHQYGSNGWGAILSGLARTPVVVAHEHSWWFEGRPLRRSVDRDVVSRRADAFIAVSNIDRRRMIDIEHIDPAKVVVIPNGIPAPPTPSGRDLRAELGIDPGVPVIGTVSVLRVEKALPVLIEAAEPSPPAARSRCRSPVPRGRFPTRRAGRGRWAAVARRWRRDHDDLRRVGALDVDHPPAVNVGDGDEGVGAPRRPRHEDERPRVLIASQLRIAPHPLDPY